MADSTRLEGGTQAPPHAARRQSGRLDLNLRPPGPSHVTRVLHVSERVPCVPSVPAEAQMGRLGRSVGYQSDATLVTVVIRARLVSRVTLPNWSRAVVMRESRPEKSSPSPSHPSLQHAACETTY